MADSSKPRPSGTFTAIRLKAFAEELRKQAMRSHEMTVEEFSIYERLVRETDEFIAMQKPRMGAKTHAEAMQRIIDAVRPPPLTREEKAELIRKLDSDEDLTDADVEMLNRVQPEGPMQEDFTERVMNKLFKPGEKEEG